MTQKVEDPAGADFGGASGGSLGRLNASKSTPSTHLKQDADAAIEARVAKYGRNGLLEAAQ
jgi:hypothetical protein